MHINLKDALRLKTVLLDLFAPGLDIANFVPRGFAAIQQLVPGEFITYSRAKPGRPDLCEVVFSTTERLPSAPLCAFARLKTRYPLWDYRIGEQGGRPIFRRDYFTEREFRDCAMHAEVYRPMGLKNHAALPLAEEQDGTAIFFSIERSGRSDFTERDRAVLARLQPPLAAARLLARERARVGTLREEHLAHLGLTARETEVFFWMIEGKRNLEIAQILNLALSTVKDHVRAIFLKLGMENRLTAIRFGLEQARRAEADELAQSAPLHRFRANALSPAAPASNGHR
ncbi:MAG: hypothetical protein HUU04_11445 [Verrucomicrobiae bacterium]|nr:hypothetical protein [Verrucomicrobiae bacterium]